MQNVAQLIHPRTGDFYLGPAEVTGACAPGAAVEVRIPEIYGDEAVAAHSAVNFALAPGDRVLAIQDRRHVVYIIGRLQTSQPTSGMVDRIDLADGTHAVAGGTIRQPTLRIYSNRNQLMLEYDAVSGRVSIDAHEADLQVRSVPGTLRLEASDAIRLEADRVDIVGRSKIALGLGKTYERLRSSLTLLPGAIGMAAQKLDMAAKRGEIDVEQVRCRAGRVESRLEHLRTLAGKIDITARTIVERTKTSYRQSEELCQTRSGRLRMLIDKTFHVKSRTTILKAEEDVKVKAEKIHLG